MLLHIKIFDTQIFAHDENVPKTRTIQGWIADEGKIRWCIVTATKYINGNNKPTVRVHIEK